MDCHIVSACSFVQLKAKPQESNIFAWTLGNSTASHWYTKCLTGALGRITSTFSETLGFMTTLKSSNCPFKQGCNPQGCTKAYFRPEGQQLHLILRRFDICFDVTLSLRFRVAIDGFWRIPLCGLQLHNTLWRPSGPLKWTYRSKGRTKHACAAVRSCKSIIPYCCRSREGPRNFPW